MLLFLIIKGSISSCELNAIECVTKNKYFYNAALPGVNSTNAKLEDSPCKCLPDCELYQYPRLMFFISWFEHLSGRILKISN